MNSTGRRPLRIVCISDTHGQHRKLSLPPGDILIHAGDLTNHGHLDEVEDLNDWLGTLNHLYSYKIVICGNHDFCFEHQAGRARARITNAIYLEDEAVTVEGIKVYGSPWQPWFGGWAFNLQRGPELAAKWAMIPHDTQILITHGPPEGILDRTTRGEAVGCRDLLDRVLEVKPRLHVFGHIHETAGRSDIDGIAFVNASTPGVGNVIVFEWN